MFCPRIARVCWKLRTINIESWSRSLPDLPRPPPSEGATRRGTDLWERKMSGKAAEEKSMFSLVGSQAQLPPPAQPPMHAASPWAQLVKHPTQRSPFLSQAASAPAPEPPWLGLTPHASYNTVRKGEQEYIPLYRCIVKCIWYFNPMPLTAFGRRRFDELRYCEGVSLRVPRRAASRNLVSMCTESGGMGKPRESVI